MYGHQRCNFHQLVLPSEQIGILIINGEQLLNHLCVTHNHDNFNHINHADFHHYQLVHQS